MKKNTGCNDNHGCPPAQSCDVVPADRVDCVTRSADVVVGANPTVIKVPVPLANVTLEADVEAEIHLPTPAREIKHIRKNVSLKQCKAIPSLLSPPSGAAALVKLYVTGIVHKNIQYVEECTGFVRDYSVDVEFKCNQTVPIFEALQFPDIPNVALPLEAQGLSVKNSVFERRELADNGHGADRCTTGSLHWELFNEPIKCELDSAVINELDLFKDFNRFGQFERVTEKMEVLLFFTLLQVQRVSRN